MPAANALAPHTNGRGCRRWLPRGVDHRTRGARRWCELRRALETELGHPPTGAQAVLLDAAADMALAAEALRVRLTAGDATADEVIRAGSELRRLRRALGLDGNVDEPGFDHIRRELEDLEAGLI